jgi:hypothetical protein
VAVVDSRNMQFFVAEVNGSRDWTTARGSASACWGALCGVQGADPFECQLRGWQVLRCTGQAIETDLRFLQTVAEEHTERDRLQHDHNTATA